MQRTWVGSDNDDASNGDNWSPTGAPHPGDILEIAGATPITVMGQALAGDTVSVARGETANINLIRGASLNLDTMFSSADLDISGTVSLNAIISYGHLNTTGGTIRFIGTNQIGGLATADIDSNLTGNATINLVGGQGAGASVKVEEAVGSGLTFNLGALQPCLNLDIVHPDAFRGLINFRDTPAGIGTVLLEGITAQRAYLTNSCLELSDGHRLTDVLRVSGGTESLTLQQTSSGVAISQHGYSQYAGTSIPLIHAS